MKRIGICASLMVLFAVFAGADDSWIGPVGVEADWNVGANWASGVVPDAEIAFVDNGGNAVMPSGTVFNNGTVAISQGSNWSTVRIEPGASLFNTKILVSNAGSGRGVLLINGGSIDTSTKDFTLGQNSANATGIVVMTGGEVTTKNFYVGYTGTGFFTLSNGVFRTTTEGQVGRSLRGEFFQEGGTNSYDAGADLYLARFASSRGSYTLNGGTLICSDFVYLGYANQAEGFLTLNGGTLVNSNNVVIGAASGGNGTVIVNGGDGNWKCFGSVLRVGYGTGSTGTLTMNGHTNVFNSMNVGDNAGSTGRVTLTECDLTINSGLAMSGALGAVVQNGGKLAVTAGGLSIGGTASGVFTASNGAALSANRVTITATGQMGLSASGLATSDLTVSGVFTTEAASTVTADTALVGVAGAAQFRNSMVTVTNAFGNASITIAYGGQLEQDGGHLTLDNLVLSAGATKIDPPAFRMTDGVFVGKARTTLNGGMPFVQTGGVVSNKEFYVYGLSNNVARFEISGGTFTLASPNNFAFFNSGGAEFFLKGSAPDVSFNHFSYVGGATKLFLLTFLLDKSPSHLSPVNFTGTSDLGYRCGHLRVGFDGGVALMGTNTFSLLTGVKNSGYGYLSKPDANMWTETLADETSHVTLASGYKAGALSMGGAVAAEPFGPMPMGHVEVSNLNTFRLIELNVRLAVQAGAETLSQVVDDFVAAGYTNSVVETDGDYNVKLVIPADCVADHSAAPVSYFAWDFTRTDSITNLETVVTNATVTGVKFEYTKLPALGTLIKVN